ncbi:hypothetical protein [Nitrosomonas supralitoralis]|uniref:Uncharacterized protein n=1 Tax=Nitrosomonas supralitoralis TaxID=2116706 RepID=A0A2P7NSB7_9PROT|nr:hypothetical protein [Nitrosomonas supralitoralis]PSJ16364.1 hypothetical protein C7H79_13985 [Nitrosomonas supralitoralis]
MAEIENNSVATGFTTMAHQSPDNPHIMKRINRDKEGLFNVNLSQNEIITLVSGYIPYLIFERDPEIPEGEFLWINYVPKEDDIVPSIIAPFPCRILSYVCFVKPIHILTLSPDEFSVDFMEMIEEFKANMEKSDEYVRSTMSLPNAALSPFNSLQAPGSRRSHPGRRV